MPKPVWKLGVITMISVNGMQKIGKYPKIMVLAKMRGNAGITVKDVQKFMDCDARQAISYITQCRQKRWLRVEGRKKLNYVWVASAAYDSWLHAQGDPAFKPERLYPSVARDILLKGHDEDFVPRGLGTPTQHPIGSEAKIEVLRQRVEQGYELFHPDDSKEWDTTKAKPVEEIKTTKITVSNRKFLAD